MLSENENALPSYILVVWYLIIWTALRFIFTTICKEVQIVISNLWSQHGNCRRSVIVYEACLHRKAI